MRAADITDWRQGNTERRLSAVAAFRRRIVRVPWCAVNGQRHRSANRTNPIFRAVRVGTRASRRCPRARGSRRRSRSGHSVRLERAPGVPQRACPFASSPWRPTWRTSRLGRFSEAVHRTRRRGESRLCRSSASVVIGRPVRRQYSSSAPASHSARSRELSRRRRSSNFGSSGLATAIPPGSMVFPGTIHCW